MIKKIGTIKHFAVFENYNWDLSSTDKNGQPLKFEKINILYGRNYSGKTTLSRIFRSLETGQLPENYDNPQYELIDENGMKTDQNNISDFSYPVRVFNEDFIKRNLKFLIDPNGEIAPFAILGNNNLYFKYPTDEELLPKLKRFFEPEDVPPILINRLVNEDSHGPTPENSLRAGIDPETIPVAKKILQLLQKDSEQYDAFMESIS